VNSRKDKRLKRLIHSLVSMQMANESSKTESQRLLFMITMRTTPNLVSSCVVSEILKEEAFTRYYPFLM